jgi:hypothetical protein
VSTTTVWKILCPQTAGSNTLLLAGSSRHLAEASNE